MSEPDTDRFDLRIESRFKNALLYNALHERFSHTAELLRKTVHGIPPLLQTASETTGIPYGVICGFLCLSRSPFAYGRYSPTATALAQALDRAPEELFPPSLYALNLPKLVVREVASPDVISLQEAAAAHLLPSVDSIENSIARREAIEIALAMLKPQEQEILKSRFGFNGPEETLREIGERFHVSQERIRQSEAHAMRKLRHPSRSKQVRPYLHA